MLAFLGKSLVGQIAAPIAALLLIVCVYQYAQINGLPIFGGGLRAEIADLKAANAQAVIDAVTAARADQIARDKITQDIAVKAAEAIQKTITVTRTIIREVPRNVTPEIDRSFPVPLGFVRVHDAAASGNPVDAVSIAPGQPNDAASDVAMSEVAGVSAGNFGACHANAEQLKALQAWIVQQQAKQP